MFVGVLHTLADWQPGTGQAIFYAMQTGKRADIVLIVASIEQCKKLNSAEFDYRPSRDFGGHVDDRVPGRAARERWKNDISENMRKTQKEGNPMDTSPSVRWSAAVALGKIGPDAKAAVPALIEALKDENSEMRRRVAVALGNIGPDAKAAVPALIEALKDENKNVRDSAAVALGTLGPDAKAAVPVLIEALKDEGMVVRREAAGALGEIGPDAKAVVPALIAALKDEDWRVRGQAAEALGRIQKRKQEAKAE